MSAAAAPSGLVAALVRRTLGMAPPAPQHAAALTSRAGYAATCCHLGDVAYADPGPPTPVATH